MNKLGKAAADRELVILRFIDKNSEDGDATEEELQHFALKAFGVRFLDSVLMDLVDLEYLIFYEEMYVITYLGEGVIRPSQQNGGTNG